MKKIMIFGLAAVAVLVVVSFYVLSNLDSIVQRAIEKYGSEILGTRVTVGAVEIGLTEGRGTIRGLRVANPPGFSSGDALSLGEITIQIDPESVTGNPIVIPQVKILAPKVNYEVNAKAHSNVNAILDNVSSGGGSSEPKEPAPGQGGGEPLRISIGSFVFEEGDVSANLSALGHKQGVSTPLPAVRMHNVGGRNGASPDEVGQQIASEFLGAVERAIAGGQIGSLIKGAGQGVIDEAGKAAKGLLDKVFK